VLFFFPFPSCRRCDAFFSFFLRAASHDFFSFVAAAGSFLFPFFLSTMFYSYFILRGCCGSFFFFPFFIFFPSWLLRFFPFSPFLIDDVFFLVFPFVAAAFLSFSFFPFFLLFPPYSFSRSFFSFSYLCPFSFLFLRSAAFLSLFFFLIVSSLISSSVRFFFFLTVFFLPFHTNKIKNLPITSFESDLQVNKIVSNHCTAQHFVAT
jgi:hypothetical protein